MFDEEESSPKKQVFNDQRMLDPPPVLAGMSVADLQSYIAALHSEIARAQAEIANRQGARGHADSFFRFQGK